MGEERFQDREGDGREELGGDLNRQAAPALPVAGSPDGEAQLNNWLQGWVAGLGAAAARNDSLALRAVTEHSRTSQTWRT